ncbi:MAG TPA: TatD family hydrolase [Opitutus sp.]|nr:TatD family hydrolase [Opitutus sp.]
MVPLLDAHNHLQDPWLKPHLERVLRELPPAGVRACVVNGTSEQDWPDVATLCTPALGSGPSALSFFPAYGLHPWNVGNASPHWRDALLRHLDADPRASIGEIGLDRWMLDRAKPDDSRLAGLRRAPLEEQRDAFLWQLELAAARDLPVTIHCIDAWGALADALRRASLPSRGFLLHSYGGSAELAREFAAAGAYFSFNGYFLGERATAKRDVFKTFPADRLLVETDAPAMPLPAERRTHELPGLADGNPINHPANLRAVYAGLAEVRGLEFDALAAQIEQNFRALFGPPPR